MFSNGYPEPPAGGSSYTLTTEQEAEFLQLRSAPNGGINFDGATFTAEPATGNLPPHFS